MGSAAGQGRSGSDHDQDDWEDPASGEEQDVVDGADIDRAGGEASDAGPDGSDAGPRRNELDDLGRRILEFERRWWRSAGAKDQAVRDTFGLSPTRYYQLLNALLDDEAALAADPVTVRRLLRLRATRTVR